MPAGNSALSAEIPALESLVCASVCRGECGREWPVTRDSAPLGSVIILSAEDDPKDTIRPRLEAAGADLTKIHLIEAVRATAQDGSTIRRGFSLSSDIPKLIVLMHELGDVRLVIIDPISAYFGSTDSHKNVEVRTLSAVTPATSGAGNGRCNPRNIPPDEI